MTLTADEQQRRRDWFREHRTTGVAFNAHCGMTIRRWDPDGVTIHRPFAWPSPACSGCSTAPALAPLLAGT